MRWFFAGLLLLSALWAISTDPAAAAEHQVSITDTAYEPATITVTTADDIVWCNDGTTPHTVTADNGAFNSGSLPATQDDDACFGGPAASIDPGTYAYHCTIDGHTHTGTLIVEAAPTTTTTAAAATTVVAGPGTTARPTATTRRTTTTKPVLRRSVTTRPNTTTTTAAPTTTTDPFATSSTEFTTTTFGAFAINETGDGGEDRTLTVVLFGLVILGGAGYLGYRYRYRFMR